jgi:hypothetical protein
MTTPLQDTQRQLAEEQQRTVGADIELQRTWLELYADLRRAYLGLAPAAAPATWQQLVDCKVATGLSRVKAIWQAAKERPDLYAAQNTPKEEAPAPPPPPPARPATADSVAGAGRAADRRRAVTSGGH